MPKFRISVSRNQKRHTFVVNSTSEKEARDKVHREGYSILSIKEFEENSIKGQKFIFEGKKNGELKKGKVFGNDIFKIYLKLRDGVGYDVIKFHSEKDENLSETEKQNFLKNLEEQYKIYKNISNKKSKSKKEKNLEQSKLKEEKGAKSEAVHSFYLKKELEETNNIIKYILLKLKNILEKNSIGELSMVRRQKVNALYSAIIKIRSSTNIAKLREVGILALEKIGELELDILENKKDEKISKEVKSTNKLLKKLGSDTQFIEKSKDIKYIITTYLVDLKKLLFPQNKKEDKKQIDKTSYSYLKNQVLLKKYYSKKVENTKEIIKNFYLFLLPFFSKFVERKDEILIKRSVINQNIFILEKKVSNKSFSYTKIKKGMSFLSEQIFLFFKVIRTYLFYTVLIYSLLFILFLNLDFYSVFSSLNMTLNYNGIFYFLIFLFSYFAIYFSRNILFLIINFVFLFFITIFGVVNF